MDTWGRLDWAGTGWRGLGWSGLTWASGGCAGWRIMGWRELCSHGLGWIVGPSYTKRASHDRLAQYMSAQPTPVDGTGRSRLHAKKQLKNEHLINNIVNSILYTKLGLLL